MLFGCTDGSPISPLDALNSVADGHVSQAGNGSAWHGYLAPEVTFDATASPFELCAEWADDFLFSRADGAYAGTEFFSFDFYRREASENTFVKFGSSRNEAGTRRGCYTVGNLPDGEYEFQVVGMARHGKGRTTTTHHTQAWSAVVEIGDTEEVVYTVSIDPTRATIIEGDTYDFSATVRDAGGNVVAGATVDWSSDDEDVATVDGSGNSRGVAPGIARISASYGDVRADATLTVEARTPEVIIWGATVVYFTDFSLGTDQVLAGLRELAEEGVIELTVETTRAGLRARLADDPDVLVYFNQNWWLEAADVTSLVNWIQAGNKMIYSDWTRNSTVLAALETASGSGHNQSSLTFSDLRVAEGVQQPMPIVNPGTGWNIFSTGLAPVGGAVSVCTFPSGESCLVYGNQGRTVTVGFLNDTVTPTDGRNFTRNLLRLVVEGTVTSAASGNASTAAAVPAAGTFSTSFTAALPEVNARAQ
jgi:hypothetical protein